MFGVDRFGTLLFFLLFAFLISDSGVSSWPNVVGSAANVGALVAGFTATGLGKNRLRLGVLAAIGVTSAVLVGFDEAAIPLTIGAFGQAIVGAIAAYVLIGLIFAWIYLAMRGLFEGPILDPDVASLPTYYSFEVLTTLGFGDITPVNDFVQRLTALEAIAGQIFLATLMARLVAMYGSPARSQ